ncbi:MAG: hypothetical protein OEZ23_02185 [Gammaproteobacteria bacterium]|nr:hypothetical protein [Gammaproteobacteria bacterium]
MKTLLKWLGISIAALILALALFFFGMRFHDGPWDMITGGPFTTGESSAPPADWSFLKEDKLTEFQTLTPQTSRTVWLGVHQGRLFLVSGYMNSTMGKIWKQWPHYMAEDNRIILRHGGKLYELQLQRQMEGDHLQGVLDEFGRKYGLAGTTELIRNQDVWLYEALPRQNPGR